MRASVGRPIYSSVIDTVGVITRETEPPTAAAVTLNVGVTMSEIFSVWARTIDIDRLGVMDKDIEAGLILIASIDSEGDIVRARVVGRILKPDMAKLGEILREMDALRPPNTKEIVGVILRLRDAGVVT